MSPKAAGAPIAGAIVIVLAWLAKQYAGVDIPGDVQTALAAIIGAVASYLIPHPQPTVVQPLNVVRTPPAA